MTEQTFWDILALFDWSKVGHARAVMQPAINYLAHLRLQELNAFDEILAAKLYALDAKQYAKYTGFGKEHYSVDSFLYNRCCVVANGQAFYEQVLNDPTLMCKELDFQSILYLTFCAAEQQGIRDYYHHTRLSYETFSNREGWKDVVFPGNLPPGHRPAGL